MRLHVCTCTYRLRSHTRRHVSIDSRVRASAAPLARTHAENRVYFDDATRQRARHARAYARIYMYIYIRNCTRTRVKYARMYIHTYAAVDIERSGRESLTVFDARCISQRLINACERASVCTRAQIRSGVRNGRLKNKSLR